MTPASAGQPDLVRGIRRWDLVAVAINGILGAGIFGLPSKVYALIGPYSLLAVLACALVASLIIFSFAEVASRFSETGGPYVYARASLGPVAGFEVGWLMWLARLTAFAANLNLMIEYLGYFVPGITAGWARAISIAAIVAVMTVINLVGVRDAAMVSNAFSIGKLIPILLFILAGLFFLDLQRFSTPAEPTVSSFSQSVMLLVYAFTGFEMALIPAGEVRDPHRNVPFAILAALAIVAITYVGIQAVCIGTLPSLASSTRPVADAALAFLGPVGGSVISVGVIVSIFGNLIVLLLAAARLPFAMAANQELPRAFGAVHARFRTPHIAILATSIAMLALALSGTFIYAATISTLARLLAYIATAVGLLVLRRRDPHPPFKLVGGPIIPLAAIGLTCWLLGHSTAREARDAAIAAFTGLAIYGIYKVFKPRPAPTAAEAL